MNNVVLAGRLTRDPESRTTQNGSMVTTFTLAVPKNKDEADFISCTTFSKNAELVSRYAKKGYQVVVRGRLQNRHYEDSNGNKRVITDVLADSIYLMGGKETTSKTTENMFPETTSIRQDEIIVSADDLPF